MRPKQSTPAKYSAIFLRREKPLHWPLVRYHNNISVPHKSNGNKKELYMRFQVLTAASMMFRIVFWDILVLPCKTIVDLIPDDGGSTHL
jgi:hypothetical protein